MKGIQPRYTGEFKSREDVELQFQIELENNVNLLFADYDCPPYEGYAWVLFEKEGALFEVYGSHCSCYGLEGQWQPEQTSIKAIRYVAEHGTRVDPYMPNGLEDILAALEKENYK